MKKIGRKNGIIMFVTENVELIKKLQIIKHMSFIVRIELNSNMIADFDVLHRAMQSRGFGHTIRGDDNKDYYLPKATYHAVSSSTAGEIRNIASEAVAQTGKTAEIIVAQYSTCAWVGLKEVK